MEGISVRAALALGVLAGVAQADIISVTNPFVNNSSVKLSDLYAWDEDGTQHEILKAGFGEAESGDDVVLAPAEGRVFPVGFTVSKLFVSYKNDGNSETEWFGAGTNIVGMSASLIDPTGDSWLHIEAFDEVGMGLIPPIGSTLEFVEGFSVEAPGWFVGTSVDIPGGVISDGFSGLAEVAISGVEVVVTPAPASAALLGLGGLIASRRRR